MRSVVSLASTRRHSGGDHVIVFAAEPVAGELCPQASEVLETGFFAPDALPEPMAWWHEDRIRDALSGIGGSVARLQDLVWPFEQEFNRRDLRSRLETSGLSTSQFYLKHFGQRGADDGKVEVKVLRHD